MVDAKEYFLDDIWPQAKYTIEVIDDKHEPVKQADFVVSVDGRGQKAVRSDDSGIIRINAVAPAAEIKIAFG